MKTVGRDRLTSRNSLGERILNEVFGGFENYDAANMSPAPRQENGSFGEMSHRLSEAAESQIGGLGAVLGGHNEIVVVYIEIGMLPDVDSL